MLFPCLDISIRFLLGCQFAGQRNQTTATPLTHLRTAPSSSAVLPKKEVPKPLLTVPPMRSSSGVLQTTPNPPRQLPLDPLRPKPPIDQQHGRVIPLMPDRPPNTLIHRPHAHILVEVPSLGFSLHLRFTFDYACGATLQKLLGLNVRDLRLPERRVRVREGQADADDSAAETVREVDAFGEGAVDNGEEEGAAVGAGGGVDGGGVGLEEGVGWGAFGF